LVAGKRESGYNTGTKLCFCSERDDDINRTLHYDLAETVLKRGLHKSLSFCEKDWVDVASEFQKDLKPYFTEVSGRTLHDKFEGHVKYYLSKSLDLKCSQHGYHKIVEVTTRERDEALSEVTTLQLQLQL
jgi:hypothetical protein